MSIRFLIPGTRTIVGSISVTGRVLIGSGSAAVPALASPADSDTGLYFTAGELNLSVDGAQKIRFTENGIIIVTATGPQIRDVAASGTTPSFAPNRADINSGLGQNAAGELSLITSGTESVRVDSGGHVLHLAGTAALPSVTFITDPDTGMWLNTFNNLSFSAGGVTVLRVDNSSTAGNTRMFVYDVDNATLERVTVGIADSGGAGFKVLRIPN